jgi:hypothetical protein
MVIRVGNMSRLIGITRVLRVVVIATSCASSNEYLLTSTFRGSSE